MARGNLIFVGPFPPPVHGQAVATQAMWELLAANGIGGIAFDTGKSGQSTGTWARMASHARAALAIVFSRQRHLYISVNSNTGIILTAALALLGRLRGKCLTLHHHSYSFISRHHPLMALLVHAAGRHALHVTNCHDMGAELAARYVGVGHVQGYSNVGVVDATLATSPRTAHNIVLGHMSNLTEEKGLGRTVDAFRTARTRWPDMELHVAGPCAGDFAQATVESAQAEFGAAFTYLGPVYGEAKQAFFDGIDIFVFPSLYATETQGIVNLEAMACGKPVIAYAQCCIGSDIGEEGGVAVPKGGDFAAALSALVGKVEADRTTAGRMARGRFEMLLAQHAAERETIISRLGTP